MLLSVSLLLALFVGMAVTVSASEMDSSSGWLDVLEYSTFYDGAGIDDGTFFPLNGYQPFGVELPKEMTLYSVDMIMSIDGNVNLNQLEIQFVWHADMSYKRLTVIHIGDNLYRAYGEVPSGNYGAFDIRFWNHDGQTYYIDVKSMRVQTVETTNFRDIGSMQMSSAGGTTSGKMIDDDTAFPIVQSWSSSTEFNCTAWCDNWIKYDYLEFVFTTNVDSVLSVSSFDSSGHNFPTTVSYFDDDGGARRSFIVRLDLTSIDRTQNNYFPNVLIRGLASGTFSVTLHSVTGHIKVMPPSVEQYWWNKLFNTIGSWFSSLGQWLSSGFQSVVDKLDMLITGGAAGDALQQGSDQLKEDAGNLKEDIGAVEDFENEQFGALDENMGDVVQGANIGMLATPLLFIQSYLNKIVQGIPSTYLIVFTLPLFFGLFLYIVQHPVRSPRPDTSGDIVTRETFTETTILSGPRAGKSTSSRTVTTTHEIGRVHDP